MKSKDLVPLMEEDAQRLQEAGSERSANLMRAGAEHLRAAITNTPAPGAAQIPASAASIVGEDGQRVAVVDYGDQPRQSAIPGRSTPIPGADFL